MMEQTMYCGICGGPLWGLKSSPEDQEWLSKMVILSSRKPELRTDDEIWERYVAEDPDLVSGTMSSDGIYMTSVSAEEFFSVNGFNLLNRNTEKLCDHAFRLFQPFIGIHKACLQIAKHVMATRVPDPCDELSGRRVDSMRTLWDVLASRYKATVKSTGFSPPVTLLDSPRNYHMGTGWLNWRDEIYNSGSSLESELYESDPLNIIDISDKILRYLQPLSPESSAPESFSRVGFKKRLESLPNEIVEQIAEMLAPMHNPPLQCTRVLHPTKWLQGLLECKLLPYLWDLDAVDVQEKFSEKGATEWDFERLVRQLAQEGIWEYFGKGQNDPVMLRIRNRRRIWKLVEDMEVGDVLPVIVPPKSCDDFTCIVHHGRPSDDNRKCSGNLIDYRRLYPERYPARWNCF